jgi:hypothetical protein
MAAQGGHPRTWLVVASFVLCACTAHQDPAAVGGADAHTSDADSGRGHVADGGDSGRGGDGGAGDGGPYWAEAGSCEPASCASQGARCGSAEDGCGGSLSCGSCQAGEVCEGHECQMCTPTTCSQLDWQCGSGSDGCGSTLDCGACPSPAAESVTETCFEHRCCTPRSCPANACGDLPDGCGGSLDCGACPALIAGKICGHAAQVNVCVDVPRACSCELPFVCDPRNGSCCVPLACADLCRQGKYDGSDGCGAIIHCDACSTR